MSKTPTLSNEGQDTGSMDRSRHARDWSRLPTRPFRRKVDRWILGGSALLLSIGLGFAAKALVVPSPLSPPLASSPFLDTWPGSAADVPAPLDEGPRDFQIHITAASTELAFGDAPVVSAEFENLGETPVTVVLPVDGSNEPLRMPAYVWQATHEGAPIEERHSVYWCGNVNMISPEDLVVAEPGARVSLDSSWMVGPDRYFDFWKPGRYTLHLRYHMDDTPVRAYDHDLERGDFRTATHPVHTGHALSNELTFTVAPPSDEVAAKLALFESLEAGMTESAVLEHLGPPDQRVDHASETEADEEWRRLVDLVYVLAGEPIMMGGDSIMAATWPSVSGGIYGTVRLKDGRVETTFGWPSPDRF